MARHVVILGPGRQGAQETGSVELAPGAIPGTGDPVRIPLPPPGPGSPPRPAGGPGPGRTPPGARQRSRPRSAPRPALGPLPGSAGAGVQRRRRRRRFPWPIPLLALVTMGTVLVLQVGRPVPSPKLTSLAPAALTVGGTAPVPPWPSVGQAAVSVPEAGLLLQSGAESPVSIASLTKIMTAYVVLRDHPMAAAADGPAVVMSAVDEADSAANARANATSIPVVAGQSWTERQLLDGLIVHSANDFADSLARWDAGSVPAFVAKMNAQAAALGMSGTHYVDPSGIDQAGVSTAADQLRLTAAAMSIPAFAAVADQPSITVPGVGFLANYVPVVGTHGVVGVKSGFTQAAMGCVVLAAERQVAGRQVLVLAALTGQQGGADPIRPAENTGIRLVDSVAGGLRVQQLVHAGRRVGSVLAPWSPTAIPLTTAAGVTALVWPGDEVRFRLHVAGVGSKLRSGERVGRLVVTQGTERYEVPVTAAGGFAAPSLHWRFSHR